MDDFTNWHKSSYSSDTSSCVEVAFADWHKSSRSGTASNCVEVAVSDATVGVRDSKNTDGPLLAFPGREWAAFLRTL